MTPSSSTFAGSTVTAKSANTSRAAVLGSDRNRSRTSVASRVRTKLSSTPISATCYRCPHRRGHSSHSPHLHPEESENERDQQDVPRDEEPELGVVLRQQPAVAVRKEHVCRDHRGGKERDGERTPRQHDERHDPEQELRREDLPEAGADGQRCRGGTDEVPRPAERTGEQNRRERDAGELCHRLK